MMLGHFDKAEVILKELLKSNYHTNYVHLRLISIYLEKQYLKQALKHIKKIDTSKEYIPFYYNIYGSILDNLGQYKKSREIFEKEINHYRTTNLIPSSEMLDGTFQNILYLDIILHHRSYHQDLATYYEFLDRIEMTKSMQERLAGNIVFFSTLQSYHYYHPLFLEFINTIKEKNYLTGIYQDTIQSAYSSYDSYFAYEDNKVSSFAYNFLSSFNIAENVIMPGKERNFQRYMCQYYPTHQEEIAYIKEKYPNLYEKAADFIEKMKENPTKMAQRVIYQLLADNPKITTEWLWSAYEYTCTLSKDGMTKSAT